MVHETSRGTSEPGGHCQGARPCGYDVVRIVLGALLIAASVLKSWRPAAELSTWGDPALAHRILSIAVAGELTLGLWLLFGFHPRVTWHVAFACFAAFACIAAGKAVAGESSCGCFGRVPVPPQLTFAFDLAALGALLRFRPTAAGSAAVWSRPLRAAGFAVSSALLVLTCLEALRAATPTADGEPFGTRGSLALLKPSSWVGQCCPLLRYIDIGRELGEGRWTVVLYHNDCSRCREAIPAYERRARESAGGARPYRIALVEMPPYAGEADAVVGQGSPCALGRLDDSRDWVVKTPAVIELSDCTVLPAGKSDRHD
jgi:hypothetical protein